MRYVLQHGKGKHSGGATGTQQGRGHTLASAPWLYDPRLVVGISIREEAGSRARALVWARGFDLRIGIPTSLIVLDFPRELGVPIVVPGLPIDRRGKREAFLRIFLL